MSMEVDPDKIVWASDHRIDFEYKRAGYGYSSGGTANFEVEMRVNAQSARGANSNYELNGGNKFLDGGNAGEERSANHGVAFNGDDFVWRFSRE